MGRYQMVTCLIKPAVFVSSEGSANVLFANIIRAD